MRSAAPRSLGLQLLAQRRSLWAYERGLVEAVARITTHNNVWADLGSRGRISEVCEQAVGLGLRPRRVVVPAAWRDTAALCAAVSADAQAPCS